MNGYEKLNLNPNVCVFATIEPLQLHSRTRKFEIVANRVFSFEEKVEREREREGEKETKGKHENNYIKTT